MPKPLIKWAGGKTELLPEIFSRFPKTIDTFYEPFIGGGAVTIEYLTRNPGAIVIASDINPRLINLYNIVKENHPLFYETLNELSEGYLASRVLYPEGDRPFFENVRQSFNRKTYTSHLNAAEFVFLNKTCFNGLYRENRNRLFNVPHGDYKKPKIYDEENIEAVSNLFQSVDFECRSYQYNYPEGSFIYFDPPYMPVSKTSNFKDYCGIFGEKQQRELAAFCRSLNDRGVLWLLSNSCHPLIEELYKGFTIDIVECRRNINSRGGSRGKVQEYLVRNY